MRTKEQLITMFTMQEAMQVKNLGENWRIENPQNYGRAIAVEACEALEHAGFKWWVDKPIDMNQIIMEGIDMLHFEFCQALASVESLQEFTEAVNFKNIEKLWVEPTKPFTKEELLDTLDVIVSTGIYPQGDFTLPHLVRLFRLCNLTGDDVFKLYIGKNVLNKFRKDNGYKDGSYIKIWQGREDNEVLTEILEIFSAETPDFAAAIYAKLDDTYQVVLKSIN